MVEGLECRLEAGARFADDAVAGDAAVLEVQLGGRGALDAELLFLRSDDKALVVLVDHERGDAVCALVGIGDSHDGVPGGLAAVGDPALGAVEDPVVAVSLCTGTHRSGVGSGFTLGQCVRRHSAVDEVREHLGLELFGTLEDQAHGAELVHSGDQRGGATDAGDFLDDDAGGDGIGALAVVSLGNVDGVEARRVESSERFLGETCVLVDVLGVRRDFLLGESADSSPQFVVLFVQCEEIEIRVSCHGNAPW